MIPYYLPPAETRLGMRTLIGGYLPSSSSFADRLGGYLETGECVLANSARALLYVLFRYLQDIAGKDKTDVLMPGYTCYSVPAAAVKAGLRVKLYDMDPETFEPEMDDVAAKIDGRTLAVVGQHLLGIRSDISALAKTAREHGVYSIADSAQLLEGGGKKPQHEASADFTLFSFGRGKPLPLGSGGSLFANDFKDLRSVSGILEAYPQGRGNYVMPVAIRIFSRPWLYWILEKLPLGLGRTVYDPAFPVSGMPRLYQRLGVAGLEEFQKINMHRRKIVKTYRDSFFSNRDTGGLTTDIPACVRYPLLVQNQDDAGDLFKFGVRRLYPLALCDLPMLQDNLTDRGSITPGARDIAQRLITLPTHLGVGQSAAARLADEVKKICSNLAEVRFGEGQMNGIKKVIF
jgi:perosamine synthetase